jgi:protein disulfide-isomerase-like protein
MLKTLRKMIANNQLLMLVSIFVILFALFWPRDRPLFGASLAGNLGNLRGRVSLEAYETLDEGFEQKSLVLFYAPWCPHCKNIMPDWDDATKRNTTDIKMVKVNCDEHEDLAKKHGIQGFPTIKFLPLGLNNPKNAIEYKGDRKGEAFLAFIANQ